MMQNLPQNDPTCVKITINNSQLLKVIWDWSDDDMCETFMKQVNSF